MTAYHATTPVNDLSFRESRAQAQDDRVLELFRHYPWRMLTASQVFEHFERMHKEHGTPQIMKNSVRRAMSNLAREGLLIHHKDIHKIGPHGAPETYYQYNAE